MENHTKPDKNLINTVEELDRVAVTSQEAQQMEQKKLDIRKESLRDDKTTYKKNEQNTYK
ncbi:hypothetical protein JI735_24380 [Paenibacillus sonchi]|uniref:Uncharacterized protein n=3 Tax=Paenibacillus sonchi group TaxID=2044880 RepID=A0A974PAH3_9BACL|nr:MULTISPECIES: hypothetical protein [Paenibacillus sonchi group]KWX81325.1 hypothetical protein AMQ84_00295 [Paenibacillus riograndensis]KWX85119.1 hypothetical protein AMQ83_26650 [Paenibacillus riograndensis]MCE3200965.1 hypothetical protein [Paenibacillus sonchi]QQZ59722.1 hypothetical protein JI735_24380 [Paenibacillus sonchi]CQR55794.1 hypothetical protein PRIO_3391 [Paenibacillus riograndensis SBR5]